MINLLEELGKYRIVPVVVLKDISDAKPMFDSLISGGLPVAEITFRTPCAADCIKLASNEYKDMITGAGTIINVKQAQTALSCGAKFIVGPGFSKEVADFCKAEGALYIPGCVTPTEIIQAIDSGINIIKFFPANIYGGVKAIKTFSSVFSDVKFVPTGGINEDNLKEYLQLKNVFAIGGSWMATDNPSQNTSSVINALKIKNSL